MAQDEGCYFCGKERSCDQCRAKNDPIGELGRLLGQAGLKVTITAPEYLSRAPGWASRHWPDCKDWDMCVMHNWECGKRRNPARSAVEGVGKAQETENLSGPPQPTKDP